MTTASIGFAAILKRRSVERNAAMRPAFGGPVNLARLFLLRDGSMPVICMACQTLNGRTAMTCMGCAGKLPAYFARSNESARRSIAAETLQRLSVLEPRWRGVVGAAALVAMLAVGFQAWFIAHSAASRSTPMVSAVTQRAAVRAPAVDVPVVAQFLRPASVEPVPIEALPVTPVIGSALAPQQSSRRALIAEPALQRVSVSGATRLQRRAQEGDPLADCRSMWLFERAVCLNNSCAQAPLKNHPQCQQVMAQRRLDEARRDGILAN